MGLAPLAVRASTSSCHSAPWPDIRLGSCPSCKPPLTPAVGSAGTRGLTAKASITSSAAGTNIVPGTPWPPPSVSRFSSMFCAPSRRNGPPWARGPNTCPAAPKAAAPVKATARKKTIRGPPLPPAYRRAPSIACSPRNVGERRHRAETNSTRKNDKPVHRRIRKLSRVPFPGRSTKTSNVTRLPPP